MKTWVERLLDKVPLPRAVTAIILIAVTNVLLHPLGLVPIFEPAGMHVPLYRSGAEIIFALTWSTIAGLLLLVLCNYSKRIRSSLAYTEEIFGIDSNSARLLYTNLSETILGRPCFLTGLLTGVVAGGVAYFQLLEERGGLLTYKSTAVHIGGIGQAFFVYMLIGSCMWVFGSYLYFISRIQQYAKRLPNINMLDALRIFGVTSLHGALYLTMISVAALAFALEAQYIAGGSGWSRILTILEVIVSPLFFFGSLLGLHRHT